jgi:hypothetical protein
MNAIGGEPVDRLDRQPELLDTYEPERLAFARQLVATTDRAFTLVSSEGSIARLVRTRVVPIVLPLLFRFPALRRRIFRIVSQIGIQYRSSALSQGAAGNLRGGDRLPWVQVAPGQDNFAPLAALAWQVHLYGDPGASLQSTCAELKLPLHRFDWRPAMGRAGLVRDVACLLRPDGYVAVADAAGDPQRLRAYVGKWLLVGRSSR